MAEVTNYLLGLGLTLPSGFDVEAEINAAVTQLEGMGFKPFLKEAVASVMLYNPPRDPCVLYLRCGYVAISEVMVGYSVSSDGTVLTEGEDYFLEPAHAVDEDVPYTRLRFSWPQTGRPQSIRITGNRGYGEEIPDDAWLAVRDLAAEKLCTQIQGANGQTSKVKQGGVEVTMDVAQDLSVQLAASFKTRSTAYMLIRVG